MHFEIIGKITDTETIAVFQVMADQVAVALDNANLFFETQQALQASQQVVRWMLQQRMM